MLIYTGLSLVWRVF